MITIFILLHSADFVQGMLYVISRVTHMVVSQMASSSQKIAPTSSKFPLYMLACASPKHRRVVNDAKGVYYAK